MYEFTSYSSAGGDEFIDSVESGNPLFSGKISADDSSFKNNSPGSGYFTTQGVIIENAQQLYSTSATFIFSHQKSGRDPGTIFTNLSGQSGYEIGINAANKLYFNHYVDGSPSIRTFNNIPAEKNIYSVAVGEGGITFSRLDPSRKIGDEYTLEQQKFDIPSYAVTNTPKWVIGSGEYQYKGWMDDFLYFDEIIEYGLVQTFSNSLYKDYSLSDPVTGRTRPLLTGVSISGSGVTGTLGYSGHVTGQFTGLTGFTYSSGSPVTGVVDISGTIYVPVTGIMDQAYTGPQNGWMHDIVYQRIANLDYQWGTGGLVATGRSSFYSSGDEYFGNWLFSGHSGMYDGVHGSGAPGTLFGITGFNYSTIQIDLTGQSGDLLGYTGVTGTLYTEYIISGMSGESGTYTGTGVIEAVSGDLPSGYYYNYLSDQGNDGTTGLFERIMTQERGNINQEGAIGKFTQTSEFYASLTGYRRTPETNLFINGISQLSGSGIITKDQYNIPSFKSSQDYFISGRTRCGTTLPLSGSDKVLYDYGQTGNRSGILTITATSEYPAAPFADIENISEKQIFFNGIKIYSGRDYKDEGGFYPSGSVTGSTGVYFAYPKYAESTSVTGTGFAIWEVQDTAIPPYSYIFYLNGVRQPLASFVEHAGNVDFITGKIAVDNTLVNIYNST